jgi:hypothetical protein
MALNLSRNSKVFFTTNVNTVTGVVNGGGFYDKNTFEIQVQDGFTFSQNTNNETVTLSESGNTPTRAQRSFNTSLAPADFSFSTYLCPKYGSSTVTSGEDVLWNALLASQGPKTVGSNITLSTTGGTLTYNGTTTLTVTATALGATAIAVGDVVYISGISGATGPANSAVAQNYFNAVATVTAKTTDTSITFTYITPYVGSASAFTLTTANTLIVNEITDTATIIGTGGTGSLSGLTYQHLNTNADFGVLTVAGSSMPIFTTGDIYNVTFTGATVTGAAVTNFVAPAVVDGTSTNASLRLRYITPTTTATTFSGTTSVTLSKASPTPYVNATEANAFSYLSTANSDVNQLLKFGLLYIIDNVCYAIDNCVLNEATVDFGLDGIATAAWTGQGTAVRKIGDNVTAISGSFGGFDAGIVGKYVQKSSGTSVNYITNKLSSVKLTSTNDLKDSAGATKVAKNDTMTMAITGGSITINNNVTYLTPSTLGIVNTPIQYFTGTRSISGTLNAYLRTGGTVAAGTIADTGELLSDMLAVVSSTTEPMFSMLISVGGTSASTPKVQLDMPSTIIGVPTIDAQQVVSTTISFTAEGSVLPVNSTATSFDLTKTNDLVIRYYSK